LLSECGRGDAARSGVFEQGGQGVRERRSIAMAVASTPQDLVDVVHGAHEPIPPTDDD
jgi:hypothetical protein